MLDFRLCVITEEWQGRSHLDVARAALAAGVGCIQLRNKSGSTREILSLGEQILALCCDAGAIFIVNDRPDIAFALGADGVHLGEEDMPVTLARKLFDSAGQRMIIGASVSTVEEAAQALRDGADYVSLGPIFATATKPDAGAAVGLEVIAQMKKACPLPVVAIGGINAQNVGSVLQAGADAVAVISAVSRAQDMERAAAELVAVISAVPEER
jgi:thiamine-phosphate diphosphorylase